MNGKSDKTDNDHIVIDETKFDYISLYDFKRVVSLIFWTLIACFIVSTILKAPNPSSMMFTWFVFIIMGYFFVKFLMSDNQDRANRIANAANAEDDDFTELPVRKTNFFGFGTKNSHPVERPTDERVELTNQQESSWAKLAEQLGDINKNRRDRK